MHARLPESRLSAVGESTQRALPRSLSQTEREFCASFQLKYQVEWLSFAVRSASAGPQSHLSKPQTAAACFELKLEVLSGGPLGELTGRRGCPGLSPPVVQPVAAMGGSAR